MYGHPVLREIAKPVTAEDGDLTDLLANMFETMYHSDGVGLAAPQIGISKRLVVIDGDPLSDNFEECRGLKLVLINPEIEILDGDAVSRTEGCLSLPGINEDVKRVEHLRMRWTDEKGEQHDQEFSGFAARIIQHECDHLEGRVFIDHLSGIRKQLIKRKLLNIVEGKTAVDYPARYAPKHRR